MSCEWSRTQTLKVDKIDWDVGVVGGGGRVGWRKELLPCKDLTGKLQRMATKGLSLVYHDLFSRFRNKARHPFFSFLVP